MSNNGKYPNVGHSSSQIHAKKCESYTVDIYASGPMHVIEQVCRRYCLDVGLCVTITPTKYIYTGGEETGAVVSLRAYPRFPEEHQETLNKAGELAHIILRETHQTSLMFTDGRETTYLYTEKKR